MRHLQAKTSRRKTRIISRMGACLIETICKPKRILSAIALATLMVCGNGEDPVQLSQKAKTPAPAQNVPGSKQLSAKKKAPLSDLNWKRTHLMVFNGNPDDMHWKNSMAAINTALKNKAAGIHTAGLSKKKAAGAKQFIPSSLIDAEKIESMFEKVERSSTIGETVVIYLTGHKPRNTFSSKGQDTLDHTFLPTRIREYLNERHVVLVSDSALCNHFLKELTKGEGIYALTLISPGKTNGSAPCQRFMELFWKGMDTGLDLDGDGSKTVKDSYLYASKGYLRFNPEGLGVYRESVYRIKEYKELKGIKDGVLMASASWCSACRKMEPVFEAVNLRIKGSRRFYMIKRDDVNRFGSLPAILVYKGGKKVASSSGAMEYDEFVRWLKTKGVISDNDVKLKALYKRKMYESIALVAGWESLSKELGDQRAFRLMLKLLQHTERSVRLRAIEILKEGAKRTDFSKLNP
jgi:thiol-disulfide isomerase/thioredoxin